MPGLATVTHYEGTLRLDPANEQACASRTTLGLREWVNRTIAGVATGPRFNLRRK